MTELTKARNEADPNAGFKSLIPQGASDEEDSWYDDEDEEESW